jgi:hypothetical protein
MQHISYLTHSTLTNAMHSGVCIEWAYAMPGLPMQHFYRTEPGEVVLSGQKSFTHT